MRIKFDLPVPNRTGTIVALNDDYSNSAHVSYVCDMTNSILRISDIFYEDANSLYYCLECLSTISTFYDLDVITNNKEVFQLFNDSFTICNDFYVLNINFISLDTKLVVLRYIIKCHSPRCMFNSEGNLYLFHSGSSTLKIHNISLGHYGSELGSGFYTCLTTGFALNHRSNRCPIINAYILDLEEILLDGSVIRLFHYRKSVSTCDIVFNLGPSSYCVTHGGQVLFKTKLGLCSLEFIDSYYRINFREAIGMDFYDDFEVNNWYDV